MATSAFSFIVSQVSAGQTCREQLAKISLGMQKLKDLREWRVKTSVHQNCLPCVIQVGFAGTRQLALTAEQSQFVVDLLCRVLKDLPGDVGLQPCHFLCGISALAIGGDSLFTEACGRLGIPQQIFLPQPRDVFLEARGAHHADFTEEQKIEAERLLALPHVIQERVVSNASNRPDRFADTNREINRVCDIVVCLCLVNSTPASGNSAGTRDLLQISRMSGKPVLELKLDLDQAIPQLDKQWHIPEANPQLSWRPPTLPEEIARLPVTRTFSEENLPSVTEFCSVIKSHCDARAATQQNHFRRAAWIIVGTHLLATLLATLVLAMHGVHSPQTNHGVAGDRAGHAAENFEHSREAGHDGPERLVVSLLAVELLSLGFGMITHHRLNHSGGIHPQNPDSRHASRSGLPHAWGLSRLLAEINRSVSSVSDLHIYLEYLFQLSLPHRFRHLLYTINILHMATTKTSSRPWSELQDSYVVERIDHQLSYFQDRGRLAAGRLKWAKRAFVTFSLAAMFFTTIKLTVLVGMWSSATMPGDLLQVLGTLAIILPSVAVAVMSLAAANDYEARNTIYLEMALWLLEQKQQIQQATSRQEFQQLVQETELRILRETAEWYSRRSFTGVS